MRTPDQVKRDFVRQWTDKAQEDLRAAEVLLEGELEDYDPVGFHAQQAAEKFIKAFLVHCQIEFPKTHDIVALRRLVSQVNQVLAGQLASADTLTPYGVEFRYPGDFPSVSQQQARQALLLAKQVRDLVIPHLEFT